MRAVLLLAGAWTLLAPCAALGWFPPGLGALLVVALGLAALAALACLAHGLADGLARGLQGPAPSGQRGRLVAWSLALGAVLVPLLAIGGRWVRPPCPALGWDDQGTYALSAIHLAQRGTYGIDAPLVAATPIHLRHLLTVDRRAMALAGDAGAPLGPEFMFGFFSDQRRPDRLFPVFPPGYPMLLAGAFQLGGWTGMGAVQAVLVLVAAAASALLVLRWCGPLAACGTWLIVLCNPLQLWAANTLYAEPAVAALWLLALCCIELARDDGEARARVAAILALIATLVIKIDGLPLVAAAGLVALGAGGARRVLPLSALAAVATVTALAVWLRCHGHYLRGTITALVAGPGRMALAAGAAAVAVGSVALLHRLRPRMMAPSSRTVAWARGSGAVTILLLAGYAYHLRPGPAHPDQFHFWPAGGMIRSWREETFLRLGWYLHPLGLSLAMAGVCALLWRARTLAQWLCLLLGGGSLAAFGYDLLNHPAQPYAMRRFLPYAIPLLAIAMGSWWTVAGRWRRTAIAIGLASPLVLCLLTQRLVPDWLGEAGMGGLPGQLDALVADLPASSVVIIERGGGLDDLGPYLHLVGGRMVAMRGMDAAQDAEWQEAIAAWQRAGRAVHCLSRRPPRRLDTVDWEQVSSRQLRYAAFLSHPRRLPTGPATVVRECRLFVVRAPSLHP